MSALGELTVLKVDQGGPLDSDEFTYVDISSIDNKSKRIVEPKRLPVNDAPSRARQRLKTGDVLVSMTRPNLNAVAIVPPELDGSIGSTGFHVLRALDGVEPRWLFNAVQTRDFVETMSNFVQGALYPAVRPKDIRSFELNVPPLDEQRRILAEIEKQFSRLDEAVANLKRVKANLKRYKAAVLKAAVEGRLVPTEAKLARREGRSYETGTQLLQRILETRRSQWTGKGKYKEPVELETSNLNKLPEGWAWATMPEIGELNRGKSKHRPRNDERLYGGPYPFIQTGDVRRSNGSITEYGQTYSELGLQQSRLWPSGTLCITIAANIAETGILHFAACFPDSIVGFLSEEGPATVQYVKCFIQTAREYLDRYASATAQKNINLDVLQSVAVPLPPFNEQQRIVAEVDRLLSIISDADAHVAENLLRAEHLSCAVLSKAFGQSLVKGERITNNRVEQQMKKRKLPSLPAARKSEAEDHRQDLLKVLTGYPAGVSAEVLFQEAGYRGDQVDAFYRDLAQLADKIVQVLPDVDGKHWPASGTVNIQLKA